MQNFTPPRVCSHKPDGRTASRILASGDVNRPDFTQASRSHQGTHVPRSPRQLQSQLSKLKATLFSNAKVTEDVIQNVVGVDLAQNRTQLLQRLSYLNRNQFITTQFSGS